MAGVTAIDHATPNGKGGSNGDANAANADPGGMTNDEKQAVGGLLRRDEDRGAAVHVRCPFSQLFRADLSLTIISQAFDPDATPEQKAAAAGKARAALAPVAGAEKLKQRVKGEDLGGRGESLLREGGCRSLSTDANQR